MEIISHENVKNYRGKGRKLPEYCARTNAKIFERIFY